MSKPKLTVTSDFTYEFNESIKKLKGDAVLVGIPDSTTARQSEDQTDSQITNAAILAINEFGSPMNNIPARPIMTIGIKAAQDPIAEQFKLAAQNVLSGGIAALTVFYNRAGIIASTSIKKVINAQEGFPGPAASTLKARKSRGFSGTKSLIITGQLRNAITYIIKGG